MLLGKNVCAMKKYIYILTVAALAFASCSKNEIDINNKNNKPGSSKYELMVRVDDMTKANIAEATGAFTWQVGETDGDEIAVKNSEGTVYKFRAVEIVDDCARFVYAGSDEVSGTLTDAVFPYNENCTSTLPTKLNGPAAALTDGIRLAGAVSGNTVTFSHVGSLVKVQFSNVPGFASSVNFISTTPAQFITVNLDVVDGAAYAYIPVAAGSYNFTIDIIDDADNVIFSKTTSSAQEFTAGSLKKMAAIALGRLITVDYQAEDWGGLRLHLWGTAGESTYSFDYKTVKHDSGAEYPWKLNKNAAGLYYVVLNDDSKMYNEDESNSSDSKNVSEFDFIGIGLGDSGSHWAGTGCVYLYRDLNFVVTGDNVFKTDYRCYARLSASQWDYWKAKGTGTEKVKFRWAYDSLPAVSSSDVDCVEVTSYTGDGKLFYYEFSSNYYDYSNVYWGFYNEYDNAWERHWDYATINRDFLFDL